MYGLLVQENDVFKVRKVLHELDLNEPKCRILHYRDELPPNICSGCLIPVKSNLLDLFSFLERHEEWTLYDTNKILHIERVWTRVFSSFPTAKGVEVDPLSQLKRHLQELDANIPALDFCKYEKYDNFVILEESAFNSAEWSNWLSAYSYKAQAVFNMLSSVFSCSLVCRKQYITDSLMRIPKHQILYYNGPMSREELESSLFVSSKQNSIIYSWNPFHTMFSAGNIPEKLRMSKMNCQGEVIVDLYAGIGYWALPLLMHGKCEKIICCEMNPFSIAALERNFELNGLDEKKYEILKGDHKDFVDVYRNRADRVMLGYLPSSENGWKFAIEALKPQGGILHVHQNIEQKKIVDFVAVMKEKLLQLLNAKNGSFSWIIEIPHIQRVKSYGPNIEHMVFDVKVSVK